MNLEPTDSQDEGAQNENIVDIFVLCSHPDDIRELEEHLSSQGYQLTQFLDRESLFESLRAGKPNLLICDITSFGDEGCEICREIKTDGDLWRIPILLVTGISSLGDLLAVLDSNADNFIARPYDPPYLVSLIESMLISTVEKPDPEKIKTQFKIRHEDRDYVITADRRKLLEFLLSSFEIAIGRASELADVQKEIDALRATMERQIADQTRELSTEVTHLETLIREKSKSVDSVKAQLAEQVTTAENLQRKLEEREHSIAGQKEEFDRTLQDLETTRSRLAETEDSVRTLRSEKDELEHALRGETDLIKEDLRKTRDNYETARVRLEEESGIRSDLETKISHLLSDTENTKSDLNARAIEIEQLKSALAAEKSKSSSAEQEVKSILQEKDQSEQDLRQMIEDITGKAKQQAQEALKLADELTTEKSLRETTEQQCETIREETARKETALVAEKETIREHFEELQKKFDALTESYGAQGQKCSSLETDLGRLTSKNSEFEAEIKSLLDRIDTATKALEDEKRQRLCIEKNQKELAATKEREDREYEATIGALRNEQDLLKADLVRAGQENDTLLAAKQDLEEQLSAAVNAGAQSDKLSKSTASELEQANDELETERRLRHTAEENTLQAVQAKDSLEKEIRERDERIQELAQESESHKQSHGSLEEKVSELSRLYKESEDALGQAAADLETERSLRSAKEESLSQVTAAQEAREKELLAALEEKANELRERDECIRELTEESESHKQSHGSLEENVSELSRLYKVSEDALGQASADLETERSLRSAKEESFSQIQQEKSALEQKISNLETLAARIPVLESDLVAERGAITEKESGYEDRIKKLNERLLTEQDIREKSEAALRESAAQKQELEEKLAAIKLAESSSQNEQLLTATKRMQSLEEQLLDSEHEQAQKENALQDLSAKTGQIMAQLEEEREHHRKTREDLAEAHKALALSKKPVIPGEATQENDIRSHAIIRKTPELPAVVRHESHALPVLRMVHTDIKPVIVETPVKLRPVEQSSEPHIQIRSIEDLFEDPTETQDYGIHNVADSVRSTLPEPEEKGINENAIPEPGKMIPDTNTKEKTLPESENDNKNDGNPEYPDSAASPEEDKSDEIEISGEEVREEDSDDENSEDDENTEEEIDALSDTDGHVTITGESVNPQQWLELVKWAHNAPGLTREQRIRIFKFGRLIQKGKRLTGRQEEQLSELLTLAHAKGYPSTR